MTAPLIEAQSVTMTFPGGVSALADFSVQIRRGEVFAIVGASGCGKSTFLNLCAGFLQPTSGQVLLEGAAVEGIEPRCGMIFQNYALFPWKSVRANIEFGPKLNGVSATKRKEISSRLTEMVGLSGFERSYPAELSGGMRQRVALARVLANEPDVLLCDEPFAALDAMTRQVMQEELLRIVHQSGQTVIFITHSIDEALILADRVAIMSARPGRIKTILDNDLPRPRRADVQLSPRFLELKNTIWSSVEEEVRASMLLTQA